MTAVDRPDNGQDEGDARDLLDKATGLVAHNVSPAVGWWRSADAKGEPFDRELLRERYERAARDVLALSSGRAGAGEQKRERLINGLRERYYGINADGVADFVLALLGGPQPDGEAGRIVGLLTEAIRHEQDGTTIPVPVEDCRRIVSLLGGPQPDEQPVPCPVCSHGTDGWHCAVPGDHDQHTNAAGDVTW